MRQTHFPVAALSVRTCRSACGKRIPDARILGVDQIRFITCSVCYAAAKAAATAGAAAIATEPALGEAVN